MLPREHRNFPQAQTQYWLYLAQQRPRRLDPPPPRRPIRPPERPDGERREDSDLYHEGRKAAPVIHAHVGFGDAREGEEGRDEKRPAEGAAEFVLEAAHVPIEPEVDKSEAGGLEELDSDAPVNVTPVRGLQEGEGKEIHVRVELDLRGDCGGAGGRGRTRAW